MTLSLSPRYDLFRFTLPKDFLPEEIQEKYATILSKNAGVVTTPIDYLNESIQGIHIPGISELIVEQPQHGSNLIKRENGGKAGLGRINTEPNRNNYYETPGNPLDKIEKEFKVSFRMNQGLYNYYMLYETVFHHLCKTINRDCEPALYIEILNEKGAITSRIVFNNCHIDSIDGLDFSYDKTTREVGSFDITFKFNNVNFEFIPDNEID